MDKSDIASQHSRSVPTYETQEIRRALGRERLGGGRVWNVSDVPEAGQLRAGQLRAGQVLPLVWLLARLLLSVTILLVIYYQMPVHEGGLRSDLPWLGLDLLLFGALVGAQVPLILRARHPVLRSAEAMALCVCFYLMMFARIYVSLSAADPAAFTQILDRSIALYFTVTVFATVGFGDIAAATNPMKLVVTVQMILNLIVLGVLVRTLFTIGRRSQERRARS